GGAELPTGPQGPPKPESIPTWGRYIAFRRATRSDVGGWVENSFERPPPRTEESGFTCARGATLGETFMGICLAPASNRSSAPASARGFPLISAPTRSALYSRCLLIANWITMAAIGARIMRAMVAIGLELLLLRPPKKSPKW